tara:strand:- start:4223 stop:4753 length:531 start_codon:yes stop_codon:yes gene_type:complete
MLFIVKGKEEAFNEMYKRYSKKMLYFFYSKLYQDQEKANDFLQSLFLKIIEQTEKFDASQKFSTWIYTLAYNMCKNEYRKGKNLKKFQEEYSLNTIESVVINPNQHDLDYFNMQLTLHLNNLGKNHKETFILKYQQELSIKEISLIMNCAEGTVKSRLFYVTKTLAEKLKEFNTYF